VECPNPKACEQQTLPVFAQRELVVISTRYSPWAFLVLTRHRPLFKFAEVVASFLDEFAVFDSSAILVDCTFLALFFPRLKLAMHRLPIATLTVFPETPFSELARVLRFAVFCVSGGTDLSIYEVIRFIEAMFFPHVSDDIFEWFISQNVQIAD
jgi:hypothetical protein